MAIGLAKTTSGCDMGIKAAEESHEEQLLIMVQQQEQEHAKMVQRQKQEQETMELLHQQAQKKHKKKCNDAIAALTLQKFGNIEEYQAPIKDKIAKLEANKKLAIEEGNNIRKNN